MLLLRWVLAAALGWAWIADAHAQALDVTVALRAVDRDGTPDWSQARLVALPDAWGADPTLAPTRGVWYRVGFDAGPAADSGALFALYVERACSVLQVRLNGQLMHSGGATLEPVSRQCS